MTVMLFLTKIVVCALLLVAITGYSKGAAPLVIKVCVADHLKAPMFIDARNEIPITDSQAQINTLKKLDLAIDDVEFQYQKRVWQECISAVKHGDADAFISGYSSLKSDYAVFPLDQNTNPLHDYSFATLSQCLIGKRRFHTKWNSREVFQSKAFSLAVANGHFVGDAATEEAFFVEHTFTLQSAIARVIDDTVDAAIVLCEIAENKVDLSQYHQFKLAPVYPPINTVKAYLAFSNNFYSAHKNEASKVWQYIANLKPANIYAKMFHQASAEQTLHYGTKE